MEIQAVFAENMKKYRKAAKLTQEKLAEMCDTDYRYIQQIESGVRCPSLEYVERIASALNIATYRLFYSKNDMEHDGLLSIDSEQKQEIKDILSETFTKVCKKIDGVS